MKGKKSVIPFLKGECRNVHWFIGLGRTLNLGVIHVINKATSWNDKKGIHYVPCSRADSFTRRTGGNQHAAFAGIIGGTTAHFWKSRGKKRGERGERYVRPCSNGNQVPGGARSRVRVAGGNLRKSEKREGEGIFSLRRIGPHQIKSPGGLDFSARGNPRRACRTKGAYKKYASKSQKEKGGGPAFGRGISCSKALFERERLPKFGSFLGC